MKGDAVVSRESPTVLWGYGMVVLSSLLFSFAPILSRLKLDIMEIWWWRSVAGVVTLGSLVSYMKYHQRGQRWVTIGWRAVVAGLLLAISQPLYYASIKRVSPGHVVLLSSMSVAFVPMLCVLRRIETVDRQQFFFSAFVLLGGALLSLGRFEDASGIGKLLAVS